MPNINDKAWGKFLELCLAAKDKQALSQLLAFFLTPGEMADISARCLIVKELLKGQKTQRELAQEFTVSIAKITRGSNELKRIRPELLKYLQTRLLVK